jgi:hypothetical protein
MYEPAMLFSATVIGWTDGRLVTMTPKRKSFQTDVNCQIITTTKPGIEIGKRM